MFWLFLKNENLNRILKLLLLKHSNELVMIHGGSWKKSVKVWCGGWVSGAQILRFFPTYFGIFSEGILLFFEQFQPFFCIFASYFALFCWKTTNLDASTKFGSGISRNVGESLVKVTSKTSWTSTADIRPKIRPVWAKITVKNWVAVAKFCL